MDKKCDGEIVPITEWPVVSSEPLVSLRKCDDSFESEPHSSSSQQSTSESREKRHRSRSRSPIIGRLSHIHDESDTSSFLDKSKKMCMVEELQIDRNNMQQSFPPLNPKSEGCNMDSEPLVYVRIARWLRKYRHFLRDSPAISKNPNTTLFHMSRRKDCIDFLREEKRKLCKKICLPCFRDRADIHAAIASISDCLGNYSSALDSIACAVELDSKNLEYKWLKEKLGRQCKTVKIQTDKMAVLGPGPHTFPQISQVERVSVKDLSPDHFWESYVKLKKPVILLDVVNKMTTEHWDFDYIKSRAGSLKAVVKHSVPHSVEWARLEESRETTVGDFIDQVQRGETHEYLFDWSLPVHSPALVKDIAIPQYFAGNYLHQTTPGSLYHDSWPSLFIAPKGATSDLHIDAFASNFWMALFQGQKRWTFFDAEDTPLLYPQYLQSMDPVFNVNISKPDVQHFPLLSLTKPRQCVLQPGELLFVPAGSPHHVENLTMSLAVSSNHVDQSNYKQVCDELRINSLVDPRAADLLQQLEQPSFQEDRTENASTRQEHH